MPAPNLQNVRADQTRIAFATEMDRQSIYRLRHAVYAGELGQHQPNSAGELQDALDHHNRYVTASVNGTLVGFISITPPGRDYSIDKYFRREALPFAVDAGLYEVRLLTIAPGRRGSGTAALLMYAALRWIESQGGRRIVAIGRRELVGYYSKCGFQLHGQQAQSGAVSYELMSATVEAFRRHIPAVLPRLHAQRERVQWELDCPMIGEAACFHGGAFFEAVGDSFTTLDKSRTVVNADVLDAWFPPAPGALSAVVEHLPWLLRTSPPLDAAGLVRAISNARGIPADSILVGGGSSNLIYLAFREWLSPASRVLLPDPAYGEYAHVLQQVVGCRVDRLTTPRALGFRIDPQRFIERLANHRYDLAILVNPNNPSGAMLPRADVEKIAAALPAHTRLWVDEAYIDYVGAEQSVETVAAGSENLFVCKSLSKVYALSGARAAYLCGNPADIRALRRLTPPWAVSLPAQVAAVAALADPGYYQARYTETAALRRDFARQLRAAIPRMEVLEGAANFLLCLLPPDGPDASQACAHCREQEVFLRDVGNMGNVMGSHALRCAVKDAATNSRVVELLREFLQRPNR